MSYTPLDERSGRGKIGDASFNIDDDDDDNEGNNNLPSFSTTRNNNNNDDDERRQSLSEPLNQDDPFYMFREDLYRKLELVDESLAEYLRIIHQTDTAVNTHEVKDTKKQLKRHIKNAESTLKDVQMTVELVENDRDKFSHIDDKELYDRKALVHTSRDRLHRAKQEMSSETIKNKLLQDERNKAMRRLTQNSDNNVNDNTANNTKNKSSYNEIADSQARQSLLIQHQDETLDELGVAVERVNYMAGNIHNEITDQNIVLTDMDEDLTNVEQELGLVVGKLALFLNTKDKWQLGTILCLSLIAIILFLLVLYT